MSQNDKLVRKNLVLCTAFDMAKNKEYPINALRNVALSRAQSDITLNIDVDLIPSKRLYQRLTEKYVYSSIFQGPQSKKIAWVVPAFELHSLRSNVPRTRRHLRLMWSAKMVSGFQMSHYPPGHRATNHARWLTPLDSKRHVTNGYDVNYEEDLSPTCCADVRTCRSLMSVSRDTARTKRFIPFFYIIAVTRFVCFHRWDFSSLEFILALRDGSECIIRFVRTRLRVFEEILCTKK